MSSLSGQQFNTKSMTGISDAYSNNIITDTLEVTTSMVLDTGATITLPVSSIADSALSTNIPLKNGSNTFTNTNFFTQNVSIISQQLLTILGSTSALNGTIRYIDSGNQLAISNNSNGGYVYIRANDTLGVIQSIMACYYNGISIFKPLFLSNVGISGINKLIFNDLTQQTTAYPGLGNFALLNANNIFTGTNNTVPMATLTDNSLIIANTSFVKGQNYITASALTPYALLASNNTFTGTSNTVPMATLTDNSLIIANTSFVKGQNYITASALTPYALLASSNAFTGSSNTFSNSVVLSNSAILTISGTTETGSLKYLDTSSILVLQNNTNSGTLSFRANSNTGVLTSIMSMTYNAISIFKSLFLGGVNINGIGSLIFTSGGTQTVAYPGSSTFALLASNNIFATD